MLEDRDGGFAELLDQFGRGGDVEDVVIREFLAVEFFEMLVEVAVERRGLVRVLAVAQGGDQREAEAEAARAFLFLVEEIGDRAVVLGSGDEDLDGQPLT